MPTLLNTYFENTSNLIDGTGVAFKTFRVRQQYQNGPSETANGYGPNAIYDLIPATTVGSIGFSDGQNPSAFISSPWREVTNLRRSSSAAWPNPFTIRSTAVGSSTISLSGVGALVAPTSYVIDVLSTGPFEPMEVPQSVYQQPSSEYALVQGTTASAAALAEYELTSGQEDFVAQIAGFAAPSTPPEIQNVYPAAGSAILATDSLTFDVVDDSGLFRRIIVHADFPVLNIREVVHDGDSFGPSYADAANSRVAITGGYTYTVRRIGGWPVSPTLIPYAIDRDGDENS